MAKTREQKATELLELADWNMDRALAAAEVLEWTAADVEALWDVAAVSDAVSFEDCR